MSILKKLFAKQSDSTASADLRQRDDMIRMSESNGNEVLISKSEYRTKVLPYSFEKSKNNPDDLYAAIVLALQEGFFEECLSPAKRLVQIHPDKERSAAVLGIVLMKNNLLDEAQEVLESYLRQNDDSGVILTNLAKVFADKGEADKSIQTLWKALTVDPNQDNALDWWGAIHRERSERKAFIGPSRECANSW
jgi:predicted Zn-dependent protease